MLNALLSGPNPKFNDFIKQIKDDIDSGVGLNNNMSHDGLATAACAKYKNMVASDKYSKLDPKDSNILALKKKFTALERAISSNQANVTSGDGYGGGYRGNQGEKIAGVEKWRTFNKVATIKHKGETVWWCLSHKHKEKLFDGLYIWHKPEDHDEWFEKLKICRSKKDKTMADTTAATPEGSKQGSLNKLAVSHHHKEVL